MFARLAVLCSISTLLAACGETSHPPAATQTPPTATAPPEATHVMAHAPASVADWAKGAQLFDDLGDTHRSITTTSADAQKYFDQGLRLLWAFNHDESTRSFAKAAALDPHCAICFWGVALTVGPNYNLPVMVTERAKVAFEARQDADRESVHASPVERALIAALAKRYPSAQPLDPSNSGPILAAYADAMKAVARQFPADLDVQTLYAESLMNIRAWKLWTADGKPEPGTEEILATLEAVLKRDPKHPGANHYYVHAIEASPHPEKALASAQRLKELMPGAGHLVHMPAHIMQRVGRYEEAAEANRRAAQADERYFAKTTAPDYYAMYTAHNYQFLAASAAMEGRKAETLEATDRMRKSIPDEMLAGMPGVDWLVTEQYSARIRFGLWEELLAMPAPDAKLPGLTAGYLYARTVALAARGRVDEAIATLARLERLAAATPPDTPAGLNFAKDLFAVAIDVGKARIAEADQRPEDAIKLLSDAVRREDQLAYDEPQDWFFPTRHLLGAALLRAGKASEAEAVYREDLKHNPDNGWSLAGLVAALKAENKTGDATAAERRFHLAWQRSDVPIDSSAYW